MKKIAIVRRNGLGDLLCAYPLVLYFQKYEPKTKISLFVDSRNFPLIPYLPAVDQIFVFPNKGNKYFNCWRAARCFRNTFDVAYSAKTSPMKLMNLFLYWLKAKERVAYVDNSWHSRLINHPLEPLCVQHQALKTLKMVEPSWKEVPEELYPTLTIPQKKRLTLLSSPLILASATTTRFESRLDAARYARILNRLESNVLLISQKHDIKRAKAIASSLTIPYEMHFPRNFEEFMLFLDAADIYFIGDGGIGHIGAALGKTGVIMYGQTNPAEWAPLSHKMKTFYHPAHVNNLNDETIFQTLKEMLWKR